MLSVAPVVAHFPELELRNFIICIEHRVHVAVETKHVIHGVTIKFDLDEVVRVRYDHVTTKLDNLLPSTKFTSFQSESSSFFTLSTISFIRDFETLWIGFAGPEGLNAP